MSRATPDQIIAHADLLHAVDGLLTQADVVRKKRAMLDRLLTGEADESPSPEPHVASQSAGGGSDRAA
jgi:hypothetical protein